MERSDSGRRRGKRQEQEAQGRGWGVGTAGETAEEAPGEQEGQGRPKREVAGRRPGETAERQGGRGETGAGKETGRDR